MKKELGDREMIRDKKKEPRCMTQPRADGANANAHIPCSGLFDFSTAGHMEVSVAWGRQGYPNGGAHMKSFLLTLG